jgi:hypothetical protein
MEIGSYNRTLPRGTAAFIFIPRTFKHKNSARAYTEEIKTVIERDLRIREKKRWSFCMMEIAVFRMLKYRTKTIKK